MNVKDNNFELLHFGAKRRMCPGYSLGQKVIDSSFANLLHVFNWKIPCKMTKEDQQMEQLYG